LTSDPTELDGAIEKLFVTNGWTALWDGVRMGNETLGAGQDAGPELDTYDGSEAFCAAKGKQGILVFTDGEENNSAHQELWSPDYPGDGFDTSLEDLLQLSVAGAATPIYVVGLGDDIDDDALTTLAETSGGRFVALDDLEQVDDMLVTISEYFAAAHRVCTEVPSHLCGSLDVRVTHRWTHDGTSTERSSTHHLDVPCDARANGRVATILLTMDATETSEETMMTLVGNTVNWVSPVDAPRVLFVLDDFHHDEYSQDTHGLYEKLAATGYDARYLEEPEQGVSLEDLVGFDVVWFSNPGYPMDDVGSFNALLQFSEAGGGVVFQGDDMSWSYGMNFPTTPLTRLEHVANGTEYCHTKIDNGKGGRYAVTIADGPHPVITGIEGVSFLYGDDIDTATPVAENTEVVAWATVDGSSGCPAKPVVTVFTPTP
jgi:hypothetical protein